MNILVTGICGFIGSNLSRALLKKGYIVYGIDDLSVGKKEYLLSGITFHRVNLAKDIDLHMAYNNIDLIIHLASRKIPREGNPDIVLEENVLSMMNVVKLAKIFDSRIIFMSTSDVYGKQPYRERYETEDSDSIIGCPDVSRWSYAVSKMWCEQYLYGQKGLKFNIIRLFATYGSYSSMTWRAGPIPVFINQALRKEAITIHGTGQQTRVFMYIDDAIDGIMKIIERDDIDRQIFNLANPVEEVSINQLALMVWKMINPDVVMFPEMQEHIPGVKYEEVNRRRPCIKKAKEVLGFNPAWTLEGGLRKTIKWQAEKCFLCLDCGGDTRSCDCIPF